MLLVVVGPVIRPDRGWLVGWSVGRSVGRWVGRLVVGWLVGTRTYPF